MSEERHPAAADVQELVTIGAKSPGSKEALLHLLSGCPKCCAVALKAEQQMACSVRRLTADDYDASVSRAYRKALKYDKLHRKQVEQARKGKALLEQPGRGQLLRRWPHRLWNMAGYKALLEGASSALADDPMEAAKMASVAFAISCGFNQNLYSAELVYDFQARAAAETANALRVADHLTGAEEQFAIAFDLVKLGTGSQWLRADLLSLVAALHAAQRRWSLAFAALDASTKLFRSLGDLQHAGRVHSQRALYQNYAGDSEAALETNTEALRLIDPEFDPKLALKARYNQILFLADCGKFKEAERAIFEGRRELESSLGRVESIRLKWLEGRIDAGLARFASAERRLTEARDGFAEQGMKFSAVLTGLELAHVCLRQKKVRQATEHTLEAEAVFRQLDIRREQIVAVATLAECFRQRVATPSLVQYVIAFVKRAEHYPGNEFEIPMS